ncbi:M15 family metallopeptidase [Pengzhenrongella frigida]|uniref:Peptidase M15 n=1 Tax=Pengzhenrongella frigida TaxID=1259133 RepID=A0A4Q5N2A8_9MICO|nr:M15 family metallopeptidase [Cellulomonas sp. HLT2-17]RYV50717.1 peptidase M15 [Cellulomonas sp. HLT2-17]
MDGIAAINNRIAEIRGTLAVFAPERASTLTATTAVTGDSFASVLAGEVAGGSSVATSTGRLTADGAPVELAAYGNGRIPADALASIGSTGHRLWAPATKAYDQLTAAAARDGVTIGITDSYRSYESQVDVAERKGLYSQGGLAAAPGTSDHGWGRSLDLDLDAKALAWMKANAGTYGFVADTPRESWHWTYSPPA